MANVNNYIAAGRSAVRKNLTARKALADNKPDYGALGQEAIKAERDKKIAVIKANAQVANAAQTAMSRVKLADVQVDKDKSIANSKRQARKAGMLAGGAALLGVGAMQMNKKEEPDGMLAKYQELIGKNSGRLSEADQKIEDARNKLNSFSDGSNSSDTSSSDTSTDTPSSVDKPSPKSSPTSSSSSPGFEEIRTMAQKSGAKYPELVAAQWALESGWGKTPSGKNNYFGIKATAGESSTSKGTWEVINGKEVDTTANFKNYDSPQGSVDDLVGKWHKNYKGYTGVNSAGSASDAAGMLVTENYATDPAYADKLRKIMRDQGY